MITLLLLLLLWFSLVTLVVYAVVLLLTALIEKKFYKGRKINFKRSKQYRRIIIPTCFVLGILLNIGYLSINPPHNFKTAYIEKKSDKFIVTILWKGNLMVHDPISLFEKKTYIDSNKFEIPRANGIIDGLEIPNRPGSYKILKGDAFIINDNKMKVQLFYDNYDDKKIEASELNGDYDLEWRK
ncbi:MAG TPA: hypothetical protein VNX68_07245 [Nitrosopumilaceae archaeon]|nr:hypothetical protein [Nitrosopumilaceae archaeon]